MTTSGYIALHRQICNNFLWPRGRKFTELEAWIYLLIKCWHTDGVAVFGEKRTKIRVGQFITTKRQMQRDWGWGSGKCLKFLNLLATEKMITIGAVSDNKSSLVTILNYKSFQLSASKRVTPSGAVSIKEERKDTRSKSDASAFKSKGHDDSSPRVRRDSVLRPLGEILGSALDGMGRE